MTGDIAAFNQCKLCWALKGAAGRWRAERGRAAKGGEAERQRDSKRRKQRVHVWGGRNRDKYTTERAAAGGRGACGEPYGEPCYACHACMNAAACLRQGSHCADAPLMQRCAYVRGAPPMVASGRRSIEYLWLWIYMMGTPGILRMRRRRSRSQVATM